METSDDISEPGALMRRAEVERFDGSLGLREKYKYCGSLVGAVLVVLVFVFCGSLGLTGATSRTEVKVISIRTESTSRTETKVTPIRNESCPPPISSAFYDLWGEGCSFERWGKIKPDESCLNFKASKLYQFPHQLIDVATRKKGDNGYVPDTGHLRKVLAQCVMEKRPLRVAVFGNSVTTGKGCDDDGGQGLRWSSLLERLSYVRGSSLPMKVTNFAERGTSIGQKVTAISQNMKAHKADLVIIDYTMTATDMLHNLQTLQQMLSTIETFRDGPAILFFETFNMVTLKQLSDAKTEDQRDPCSVDPVKSDTFWKALMSHKVPVLSYPDIACAMPRSRDISNTSVNKLTYWWSHQETLMDAVHHPACGVHAIIAHTIFQYLYSLQAEVCLSEDGYNKTASAHIEAKTLQLSDEQRCILFPKTSLSAYFPPFPAAVGDSSTWAFGEDVPGKPGWIANLHGAANQDQDIVFDVILGFGRVRIDFLSSYENVGSATCWLEGQDSVKTRVRINGLWKQKVSIASSVWMMTNSSAPELHHLKCRADGKKFKILGVFSC
ncbi:unnamed protein product [Polarella glacialis]|uniref:Uncharacterized protein n=1 Tax=Polarella glacialis TaxID=89957 RepID=A0A813GP60_POLGL|nr:unnamed protein product [Polarella glacialis]